MDAAGGEQSARGAPRPGIRVIQIAAGERSPIASSGHQYLPRGEHGGGMLVARGGHGAGGAPKTGGRIVQFTVRQRTAIHSTRHQDLTGWKHGRSLGIPRIQHGSGIAPGTEIRIIDLAARQRSASACYQNLARREQGRGMRIARRVHGAGGSPDTRGRIIELAAGQGSASKTACDEQLPRGQQRRAVERPRGEHRCRRTDRRIDQHRIASLGIFHRDPYIPSMDRHPRRELIPERIHDLELVVGHPAACHHQLGSVPAIGLEAASLAADINDQLTLTWRALSDQDVVTQTGRRGADDLLDALPPNHYALSIRGDHARRGQPQIPTDTTPGVNCEHGPIER